MPPNPSDMRCSDARCGDGRSGTRTASRRPTNSPTNAVALEADIGGHLRSRLKAVRLSLGFSAARLDRISGFKPGTTRRLERGLARMYGDHLFRIARATGLAIEYFYGQDPEAKGLSSAERRECEEQRFLQAYLSIKDPYLRRDVFELIESLAIHPSAPPSGTQNSGL